MVRSCREYRFGSLEAYAAIREEIIDYIGTCFVSDCGLVLVVMNEAVNNALIHGTPQGGEVRVRINKIGERWVVLRVRDGGPGFSYHDLCARLKEKEVSGDVLEEGGRGVYIMYQVADKLLYNRKGNEVMIIKATGRGM